LLVAVVLVANRQPHEGGNGSNSQFASIIATGGGGGGAEMRLTHSAGNQVVLVVGVQSKLAQAALETLHLEAHLKEIMVATGDLVMVNTAPVVAVVGQAGGS
jgi:hypothetical protein